jgi:hypothetical protein
VWTYDDPSAWPVTAIDPSANADEQLAFPEQAHDGLVPRVIGTVDGVPFVLMTYHDNHRAVCGELNTGSLDASRLDMAGPLCTKGWWVEIPQDRAMLSITSLDGSGDRQRQVMFAIVSAATDHVVVTTDDGSRAVLPVFLVEGSDVGFAFVFVPPGSEGGVQAIGAGGEELDSAALCFPANLIDANRRELWLHRHAHRPIGATPPGHARVDAVSAGHLPSPSARGVRDPRRGESHPALATRPRGAEGDGRYE